MVPYQVIKGSGEWNNKRTFPCSLIFPANYSYEGDETMSHPTEIKAGFQVSFFHLNPVKWYAWKRSSLPLIYSF